MTKQELINKINQLTSEYLGRKTELHGIKSKSRIQLQIMASEYQSMVNLKNMARNLAAKYSDDEWRLAFIFPQSANEQVLVDTKKYEMLCKQADQIYFTKF